MLRRIKILLVLLVSLWGLFGGIGNLFGYAAGLHQVEMVMAREGAFTAGGFFVALTHPVLNHLGYAVIWVGKLLTGTLCLWGAITLWRVRAASSAEFHSAKHIALAGCGVALIALFGGFIVAGGVYFGMWSSELGALSHGFATQYIVCIGIIALFVGSANDAGVEQG